MTAPDDDPMPPIVQRLTMSVEEAAEALGISRSSAYQQARRWLDSGGSEGLPVLRIGRTLRVPTATLRAWLGLDVEVGGQDR